MPALLPSIATSPQGTGPVAAAASRPLLIAFAVIAVVALLRVGARVDSDVAWQLWIAGRINGGANLYTDIVETNPPLWFWMAVPLDRVAAMLNVGIESIAVVAVSGLIALSLAATNRLIGHIEPGRRSLFLGYAALALAAVPRLHMGQREQIVLVSSLPYIALIAARREGRHTSVLLATTVGTGAALGFALKHYFLVVPLLLELWLLTGQRRQWRAARAETVAILLVGAAYGAAILFLEPDFLRRIVPLALIAYGAFGNPSLAYMFGPFGAVGLLLFAMAAFEAARLGGERAPLTHALLAAALGFAGVYFIQFKGWPYHALPLIGCSSMALAAMLAEVDTRSATLRILAPALLLLPLALSVEEELHPALPNADLIDAVAGLRKGDSVGFIATEPAVAWSVTLQGGYNYPSRYMGFWMVGAILRNENSAHPDPRLTTLGRTIVAETVADFECMPPRRIVIARPRPGEPEFDILPLFLRDPRFRDLLAHYRVRSRTSLETYDLVSALQRPSERCPRDS